MPDHTNDDETLFSIYIAGDEEGLRRLIERYGDHLTLYIDGMLHDPTESEALMIEAFSRIASKKPKFLFHGFQSYLYKTARNLAFRYVSKRKARCEFSLDQLKNEPHSKDLVAHLALTTERDKLLHLCMSQLPGDYKEVLYLVYFDNLSYKEAGIVMKKSEKQITNLVYRGKKYLKPILEKEGITDAYNR